MLDGHSLHAGPDRAAAEFVCGSRAFTVCEAGIADGQSAYRGFITAIFINRFNIDTATELGQRGQPPRSSPLF